MIEKLIENWLTNTSERGYMPAYCQLLIEQGNDLLYVSTHSVLEHGKDVIVKTNEGDIVCYQLKDENIDTAEWRNIQGELEEMIKIPVTIPSIVGRKHTTSWLITSGTVSDAVRDKINAFNSINWNENVEKKLFYKDRNALVSEFSKYYFKFLPTNPTDLNNFLQMYISDGSALFPIEKYIPLLERNLHISDHTQSKNKWKENIGSSLIMTNYLLYPWIQSKNWISQIQAWVVLRSYVLYTLKVSGKLKIKDISQSLQIIDQTINYLFEGLLKEAESRDHLIEGDWRTDSVVYAYRTTIVLGFLCSYALSLTINGKEDVSINTRVLKVIKKHISNIKFCGESFVPLVMSIFFFLEKEKDSNAINYLKILILALIEKKNIPSKYGWPSVYYGYEDSIRIVNNLLIDTHEEYFVGVSYTLKSLVDILVRRDEKDFLTYNWRKISHNQYASFIPKSPIDILLWRINEGVNRTEFPNQTQSWRSLKAESKLTKDEDCFLNNTGFLLLFLLVYPHRINTQRVTLIDKALNPHLF